MNWIQRTLNLGTVDAIEYQRLYLVFNVSRTPVRLSRAMNPHGFVQRDAELLLTGEVGDEQTYPNVLAFEVLHPVEARDEFRELVLESLGEPPELVRVVLQGPNQLWVSVPQDTPCLDTLHLQVAPQPGSAAQYVPGPAQYMSELMAALQALQGPKAGPSRFFAEIDHQTLSVLGASGTVLTAVESVFLMARERLVARLKEHMAVPPVYTPYSFSLTQIEDLQVVAQLFVDCAAVHLGPLPDRVDALPGPEPALTRQVKAAASAGIDLERFEQAFELFADGQLRLQLQPSGMWSTQPSSGFYFYFAELALLAAEADLPAPLDPSLWLALANVMVRTQEVFANRYGPAEQIHHDRSLDDYKACNYRDDAIMHSTSAQRLASMRQKFATEKTLSPLASACAQNAKEMIRKESQGP